MTTDEQSLKSELVHCGDNHDRDHGAPPPTNGQRHVTSHTEQSGFLHILKVGGREGEKEIDLF